MSDQPERLEEVFTWNGISVIQKEEVFKVGTDALLLGAWIPGIISHAERILDVGSGTGILSLMMHRTFSQAHIMAIDQSEAAARLSAINFSNASDPHLLFADRQDLFHVSFGTAFNLIVCNPPYFFGPHHQHQSSFSVARHAMDQPGIWMQRLAYLLTETGHVCIVLPFSVTNEWITGGNDHGLYVSHRMNVFSFEKEPQPKRVLLHFSRQLDKPVIHEVCIYHEDGTYTDAYKSLMSGQNLSQHPS